MRKIAFKDLKGYGLTWSILECFVFRSSGCTIHVPCNWLEIKTSSLFLHHCAKNEFSIKDFFNKCDQICRKLLIWSHLLTKSFVESFIFNAAHCILWVASYVDQDEKHPYIRKNIRKFSLANLFVRFFFPLQTIKDKALYFSTKKSAVRVVFEV